MSLNEIRAIVDDLTIKVQRLENKIAVLQSTLNNLLSEDEE